MVVFLGLVQMVDGVLVLLLGLVQVVGGMVVCGLGLVLMVGDVFPFALQCTISLIMLLSLTNYITSGSRHY